MVQEIDNLEDTIAAIATTVGSGGIGIVRLSGPQSILIVDQIFIAKSGRKVVNFKSHTFYYGHLTDPRRKNELIDEALVVVMRAPKSYTCQDVVEIHSHGGRVGVQVILELVLSCQARLAKPGEFTKRAFLNGRLDLVQAEAVLDAIQAKTQTALKLSAQQLKGELTIKLEEIRRDILEAYVQTEALINFPDDDIEEQAKIKIARFIKEAQTRIEALLKESHKGRILREGARVVLCGRPNAGKSSLLNALLKYPRAIVTDIAGTTRDTIEETACIGSIPIQLIDTAGILEPRDLIEEQAILRSREHMQSADLVLFVLTTDESLQEEDMKIIQFLQGQNIIVVVNKTDLSPILTDAQIHQVLPGKRIVRVSAQTKANILQLEQEIEHFLMSGASPDTTAVLLTNVRHIEALSEARLQVLEAAQAIHDQLSLEFMSEPLKTAILALDRITGRDVDMDLIDQIFSNFCIGK